MGRLKSLLFTSILSFQFSFRSFVTPIVATVKPQVSALFLDLRESTNDTGDWRTQFPSDSRSRIVNKIMETLTKQLQDDCGLDGVIELRRIVVRFSNAINQTEYLRQISLTMLATEPKSENGVGSDDNSPSLVQEPSLPDKEPDVNSSDRRTQQPPNSREKNVNALMETLKKHVAHYGQEGIDELMRIAVSYEELIFNIAISQVSLSSS